MDPLTDNAGNRLINFGVLRSFFGREALNSIASIRAAVDEGHVANKASPRRLRFDLAQRFSVVTGGRGRVETAKRSRPE
jgi:hypothetical protein